MNVVKCSQGHFYDSDKFTVCPHCGQIEQKVTYNKSIAGSDETVALQEEEIQAWEHQQELTELSGVKSKRSKGTFLGKKKKPEVFSKTEESIYTSPITIKSATVSGTLSGTMRQTMRTAQPVSVDTTASGAVVSTGGTVATASTITSTVKERGYTVGWLVYLNGEDKGKTCELKRGNNFIGSGADMDIQIKNDSKVAFKNHAKIVFEPNKQEFFVAPGDSSELVYLGEDVVMIPQKLSPFNKIIIGDTTMLFVPLCGETFTW